MYTLKGVFPEPKKEHKKNFIRDNVKQLKYMQGKTSVEPEFLLKPSPNTRPTTNAPDQLNSVKSTTSGHDKLPPQIPKPSLNNRPKVPVTSDVKFKKGDMSEFLKRKQMRQLKSVTDPKLLETESDSVDESPGRLRDVGCQTMESNLSQKFADGAKLNACTKKDDESKLKASGDTGRNRTPISPHKLHYRSGDADAKLSPIEKKDKDPYLPPGYQKGVLPKYLRERKEQEEPVETNDAHIVCPPGHVTLPDIERKETLRMLRNSFAELVSELNKMPVRTDTLRMRNRKMELEKQLAKLEEGIKVFSRPKVFVKIGE